MALPSVGRCPLHRGDGPSEVPSAVLRVRQEHDPELADLDLVAARQPRLVDALPVDVGAVEAADVTTEKLVPYRENSACRRETVTSSRKMSLSGWRPADVRSLSSRNRLPALGPRLTSSNAVPGGNASTAT